MVPYRIQPVLAGEPPLILLYYCAPPPYTHLLLLIGLSSLSPGWEILGNERSSKNSHHTICPSALICAYFLCLASRFMDKMSIYVSKASSSACFLDAIALAILFSPTPD